jgi:homocysteine S-methyltransferase
MRRLLADAVREGVVVLDGGLATQLEAQGCDLSGGLWSARLLLEDPQAVATAHRAYFRAGAKVATTASYQASAVSLRRAGLDASLAPQLLTLSVQIAAAVRDAARPDGWVAGSVGPYGASLADGSEYTGDYGLGDDEATVRALRTFQRPRLEALLEAGADVLACETVPRVAEVEALAAELAALGAPSWVSLTVTRSPEGDLVTRAGEALLDAAEALRGVPGLLALGVNCCDPADVVPALSVLAPGTGLPGVAYPNSGQTWVAANQSWSGSPHWDDGAAVAWVAAGARLVGGCCRVTPPAITRVADSLVTRR